jgi:Esterase/lipase
MHDPFFIEAPQPKGLVIFIHGFMGSSHQFAGFFNPLYAQRYSIAALLLPGHGKTISTFSTGTADSWRDYVFAEVERYARQYDNIWLAGHSMGGLLAIQAAVKYPERIRGLFLIACPFRMKIFSFQMLRVRFQQIFFQAEHPLKKAYHEGSSIPITFGLLWRSIKPTIEFKRLAASTRKLLPKITLPISAVYCKKDEVVSLRSAKVFRELPAQAHFSQVTLVHSYHAYFPEKDWQNIEQVLLRFLLASLTNPPVEIDVCQIRSSVD